MNLLLKSFVIFLTFLISLSLYSAEGISLRPSIGIRGENITITYSGFLSDAQKIYIHWGIDGYKTGGFDQPLVKNRRGGWSVTLPVDKAVQERIDFVFYDNKKRWDNNYQNNYRAYVTDKTSSASYRFKLGAVYSPSQTIFSLWSPDSNKVLVNVDGVDYFLKPLTPFDGYKDIYSVTVPGDLKLKEYQFKINGTPVRDPYGVMIVPGTTRNVVMDLVSISPETKRLSPPVLNERVDAIIYETSIRDFTLDPDAGISPEKRGKFLGLVETGKKYNGLSTGLDHLKELGVTHVQLMPFFDFATAMYNWGYDPVNYNIPEEQYAINPNDYVGRVKELKATIAELHRQGIRVIMDVVYNHTYSTDVFSSITKQYYDGLNLSGCGNSIDTGNPMVSRYIRDSLEFWVSEYGVDGFRFDLMGIYYADAMRSWTEYLSAKYPERQLMFYGEPWNGYAADPNEGRKVRLGNVASLSSGHLGAFNSKFREAIKGDSDGNSKGYIFAGYNTEEILMGTRGAIRHVKGQSSLPDAWDPMFAFSPEQTINYVSAHDNLCLWDKIKYSGEDNDYGRRMVKFAMGIVLTSQGIPFIHSGDEFLRTKVLNGNWSYAFNSYNAPDRFNMIRWKNKLDYKEYFNYHRDLIKLRKKYKALRLSTWDQVNTLMQTHTDGRVVISEIEASQVGDGINKMIVVYNSGMDYKLQLPEGNWTKIFDNSGAVSVENLSDSADCEGTAVTVFVQ